MRLSRIVRVAHRGASAQYPENTLLAFRKAIEQGVDVLEVDVHCTSDAHLVVIHDPTLERTTTGMGKVSDCSLHEIRLLDAGQGERIPVLEEVIQLARDTRTRLCVEVKGTTEDEELALAEAIVRTLEAAEFLSRSIVTSFSSRALLRAKAIHAGVSTMLDPSPQDGSLTPRQICAQALQAGANSLSYDFRYLTPEIVWECQATGLALWPWDPDEASDLQQVIQLGVPGVMTNRPDMLNKVLHELTL